MKITSTNIIKFDTNSDTAYFIEVDAEEVGCTNNDYSLRFRRCEDIRNMCLIYNYNTKRYSDGKTLITGHFFPKCQSCKDLCLKLYDEAIILEEAQEKLKQMKHDKIIDEKVKELMELEQTK